MAESTRKLRREALYAWKEGRRALAKAGRRMDAAQRKPLADALQALAAARQADAAARMEQSLGEVDVLLRGPFAAYTKSPAREWIESLLAAVLIALFLRTFVLEAFKIPSSSMVPTLLVGDYIFVNKLIYGVRLPLLNHWIAQWGEPKHGDVIVFVYPNDMSKDYIKRVVGVPGDVVEAAGRQVLVNGEPILSSNGRDYVYDEDGDGRAVKHGQLYTHAWGEHNFEVFYAGPEDAFDPGPTRWTVAPGHLFVMGDNRDNSSDSRVWGQVPLENVKGRALVIWWSSGNDLGSRLKRIGTLID